tara:strand:+ start:487 stop:1767 length:1281 start_codon:yes stop_codon:yes gene_type:complete
LFGFLPFKDHGTALAVAYVNNTTTEGPIMFHFKHIITLVLSIFALSACGVELVQPLDESILEVHDAESYGLAEEGLAGFGPAEAPAEEEEDEGIGENGGAPLVCDSDPCKANPAECPKCDFFDPNAPCSPGDNINPATSCDVWDNLKNQLKKQCEWNCNGLGQGCVEEYTGGQIACSCDEKRPIGRWVCEDGPIVDDGGPKVCIDKSDCPTLYTCNGDDLEIYNPSCVDGECLGKKETRNCRYGCKYREERGRASCCTSRDSCLGDPDPCNHNGVCDPGENFANCAADCAEYCNRNGVCDPGENAEHCWEDCHDENEIACFNDGDCGERSEYCDAEGYLVWDHPWCRAPGTPGAECLAGYSRRPCRSGETCVESGNTASCEYTSRDSTGASAFLTSPESNDEDAADNRAIGGGNTNGASADKKSSP